MNVFKIKYKKKKNIQISFNFNWKTAMNWGVGRKATNERYESWICARRPVKYYRHIS